MQPDVILQDLLFAGMQQSSSQFLIAARQDSELAHTPIILCTGATQVVRNEVTAEQLRQLRVRVVLKPFHIDELLAVLAEALNASHAESAHGAPVCVLQ